MQVTQDLDEQTIYYATQILLGFSDLDLSLKISEVLEFCLKFVNKNYK